jgi:hypothetical protein
VALKGHDFKARPEPVEGCQKLLVLSEKSHKLPCAQRTYCLAENTLHVDTVYLKITSG